MSGNHLLAVALAVVGAVLFGLAAVRQHGAVQEAPVAQRQTGQRQTGLDLTALWHLVRQPAWLIGAFQALVAGGSHVVALALAPITLVQPIGVLAVPVTVIGSALATGRRPRPAQVLGSALGVGGVAALTVLLIAPASRPVVLPAWGTLFAVVVVLVGLGALVTRAGGLGPPLARCLQLSVTAAVLFGLNSILLRMAGHLVGAGPLLADLPLLVTAVVGVALALPVGLWAMQTAYTAGSPHVVICCLTLVDPITAVLGGYLLLHDGVALSSLGVAGALACTAVAAAGVVLLSRKYPTATDTGAAAEASQVGHSQNLPRS